MSKCCGMLPDSMLNACCSLQRIAKTLSIAALCVVLSVLLTSIGSAQNCPTLNALTGGGTTWWAFQTSDELDAQIGIFKASVLPPSAMNPFPQGVLVGTMTYNAVPIFGIGLSTTIVVRAAFTGRFTIDANDCSRGTISFMINGNAYQYTFAFAETPPAAPFGLPNPLSSTAKLVLLTSNAQLGGNIFNFFFNNISPNATAGPFIGNHGIAYLLPGPPTCKNFGDPLAQMDGTNWTLIGTDIETANIATFTAKEVPASGVNPFARGTLQGNKSISGSSAFGFGTGTNVIQADFTGTYQIYGPDSNGDGANCSGGQLFISGNGTAYQYDFVFAPPFDGNGAKRMLGVFSSPDLQALWNSQGNFSLLANYMEAFRNVP